MQNQSKHTLEELREMLRGRTWVSMLGLVKINGVIFRARLGNHLGRAVAVVIAEGQYVAFRPLSYKVPLSRLTLDETTRGMVMWHLVADVVPDELIIKDQDHAQAQTQNSDLQPGSAAPAPCL